MKRPGRGHRYRALAYGYKILKSPVADSFKAAAEHYDRTDPPLDPVGVNVRGAKKSRLNPPGGRADEDHRIGILLR